MSYSYSKQFGVQSYVAGVNYSDWMQEALNPKNKSSENARLSITSSQEDYFKKQRLIQEAIAQLQSNGSVSAEIAKEVDVESLKKSLQDAENGESNTLSIGEGSESSEARKQSQLTASAQNAALKSAVNLSDKAQNILQEATNDITDAKEVKKAKEIIKQNIENNSLANRMADRVSGGLFDKHVFTTSSTAPSNVSEETKKAHNPLAISADSAVENTQDSFAVEFTDEVSGAKVRVPLSEENAEKLREHFGSLEAASDYVKGFYYDAAYKMGYLSSDNDGDGKISLDEGIHLKTLVSLMSGDYSSISEQFGGNVEMQKKFLEQVGFIDNLGDFINHSISQDSNFDGGLSLNEILNGTNEAVFLKTAQGANVSSVEVLVIQSFRIDFNMESLNDTLLNLGAKAEDSVQVIDGKKLKDTLDTSYLESLDQTTRENWLKSETLLKNMLESV